MKHGTQSMKIGFWCKKRLLLTPNYVFVLYLLLIAAL